jgi:hypothetical protein
LLFTRAVVTVQFPPSSPHLNLFRESQAEMKPSINAAVPLQQDGLATEEITINLLRC